MPDTVNNLDLLSVGIAIAGIGILGFMVFFNNRKSITNKTFFAFALSGILWAIFNYLYQQPNLGDLGLWLLRAHAFFAVWYVFWIFQVFYVFPKEKASFSRFYKLFLIPYVSIVSILTLTPFVFVKISRFSPEGTIAEVTNGPGILIFGITAITLIFSGPFILLRRWRQTTSLERRQFSFVLIGTILTFSLHFIFNLVLPAFFSDSSFLPFSGTFIFPFVAFTAYAIFKHHLLNVKVIATEIVAFVLAIATLLEVIISHNPIELILRAGVFCLVLGFSILLIKSVLREVEQREQLEKLTEELKVANTKLEDLSRFKTQLLSLASHQIKAPLATIKQFGSLITDGIYGQIPDKVRETVGRMRYSADQLLALINDLLDLRKVEEGRMEYKFEKTDLKKMVSDVVEMNRVTATTSEKKLELTYTQPQGDVFVNADGQKLRQVVQNLVDNAIKYTNEGFVRVSLKIEGTDALVSVQDSGYGIPAVLLPQLFEEFVRDERVKKQIRGTGLGLFIARKILEAHAGKLWATSEGEGKGSTFFARLPLAK